MIYQRNILQNLYHWIFISIISKFYYGEFYIKKRNNLLWHLLFINLQLYTNIDYKYTFQRLIQTRKKYI